MSKEEMQRAPTTQYTEQYCFGKRCIPKPFPEPKNSTQPLMSAVGTLRTLLEHFSSNLNCTQGTIVIVDEGKRLL